MQVLLNQREVSFTLKDRKKLKVFIPKMFADHRKIADSIDIVFCSDAFLLEINQTFLKHDYYTDIITFNLAEPNQPIIGELYISIDTVKDNARNLGISFSSEIHRVIFHGILHLCGFRDKTKQEKVNIRKKENKYLNDYFS